MLFFHRHPRSALFLLAIFLCLPAFILGAGGEDLHTQSLWVREFSRQLWRGEWYPRWLQSLFAGDGSPVFFYYPPLAYFITALFAFLGPLDPFGYYPIAVSACLAVALSGITFYTWMKQETGDDEKAFIGSVLYILAPSHIAQDFYHSLLFSSVWAYVWVPLLMLFARRMALLQPFSATAFAASLALLVLTNLPMTLIFGPVATAYGVMHFSRDKYKRQTATLLCGTILGFGLSAFYLLPALLYIPFANVALHWGGGQNSYDRSYFFIGFFHTDSLLFTAYWLVVAALCVFYFRAARPKPERYFFLTLILAALFFMLPLSKPLWDHVPLLKTLQMAERLFVVPTVCLAVLAAFALPKLRWLSYAVALFSAAITIIAAFYSHTTLDNYRAANPLRYEYYLLSIEQYPFYLTSPDLIGLYDKPGIEKLKTRNVMVSVESGDATAEVLEWQPRLKRFHCQASQPSVLRVRQFDFPGFSATQNGRELAITRDSQNGEILIDVPAGAGDIDLRLEPLLPETAGKTLSLLCLGLIVLTLLVTLRRKAKM